MKLSGIIWLEEIVEKIERKHHVTQEEVREVLRGSSHFRFVEKRHRRGEEDMKRGKSSISKARSYAEIGEFWDEHDLSKYWSKTRKVKFDVVLEPEATYYPVAKELSDKIESQARKEGISSYALVNSWLDQKLKEKRRRTG